MASLIAAKLREGMDVPLDELVQRLADDLDQARGTGRGGTPNGFPLKAQNEKRYFDSSLISVSARSGFGPTRRSCAW